MQEKKLTSVHTRLRGLAKSAKLRNADLARIAEVSPVAVGKWFSAGQIPKAEQLLKLARHFQVSMEWLLCGHPESKPETMDERLDSVVEWLKKVGPESMADPKEEAESRDFWKDIFESEDERFAVRGSRDGPADVLVLADLVEDALKEFRNAFASFSDSLGSVEITSDPEIQKMILRGWESVAVALKRLSRRQQSLLNEIRVREDPSPF